MLILDGTVGGAVTMSENVLGMMSGAVLQRPQPTTTETSVQQEPARVTTGQESATKRRKRRREGRHSFRWDTIGSHISNR